MHFWTNTASSPSSLHTRSDNAKAYVLKKLDVPECGIPYVTRSINNWQDLPDMRIDESGASVGPLSFYPVMEMSFKKGVDDYVSTVVPSKGVVAKAKYIGVFCGDQDVHLAFVPKCGNLATVVRSKSYSTVFFDEEVTWTNVDAPSTFLLVGALVTWIIKRAL